MVGHCVAMWHVMRSLLLDLTIYYLTHIDWLGWPRAKASLVPSIKGHRLHSRCLINGINLTIIFSLDLYILKPSVTKTPSIMRLPSYFRWFILLPLLLSFTTSLASVDASIIPSAAWSNLKSTGMASSSFVATVSSECPFPQFYWNVRPNQTMATTGCLQYIS